MKRFMTLFLALAMAISMTAALAEAPAEDEIFAEATRGLLGVHIEKIGLLEEQEVADGSRILCYLCRVTPVVPNPTAHLSFLLVVVDGTGAAATMGMIDARVADEDGTLLAPDADYLREQVFLPMAEVPVGTAGASLAQAKVVCGLWSVCAFYAIDAIDPEDLEAMMEEAWAGLTPEQQAACEANAPAVLAEMSRLTDPAEQLGGAYAAGGMAEIMTALRADEAVCASVAALADAAE